ncbi:MAG TPA: class I SAM-dependent methyltransferase [Kofleriaceae bacterium]|jgi:SAM-dependent methyltransferase
MKKLDDPRLVSREYASLERVSMRRLDRTGWLRGDEEPWLLALRAIAEPHPTRILEVGSGAGDFAVLLAAPEVVCVDVSATAVEAARMKGLAAHVADVRRLPFTDGSFDVVVANWVLYHVRDRAQAVAEMARVLTPTGRFVGCYNAPGHLQELWSKVAVPTDPDDFNAVNGADELSQTFDSVETRRAETEVLWETRHHLQSYLDAYSELYGRLAAPKGPYPFHATRRNVVFVASGPRAG